MGANENLESGRRWFEAAQAGDAEMMREFMADDIVFHFEGDHALAGHYHGPDELIAGMAKSVEMTGGTLRVDPIDIAASNSHLVFVLHATAEREGKKLDNIRIWAVAIDADGKWKEGWGLADAPGEEAEFWS